MRRLTLPGIGPVRWRTSSPIIVTPFRFSTKRDFFGYCGLGIVTRSSDYEARQAEPALECAVRSPTPQLNHSRNPLLKAIFKGAALSVIAQTDHPLRRDYIRCCRTQATARPPDDCTSHRFGHPIWKRYDPAKHCTTDAK